MTQFAQQNYVEKCRKAAKEGNVVAQNTLGFLFLNGQGVEQDYEQAAKWFERAATKDYAPAQFNLAIMFKLGQGVAESQAESIKWMQKAANQDYVDAQSHLGNMFYQGLGVMQDFQMAYMWWTLAEENGANDIEHIKAELLKKMTDTEVQHAMQSVQNWKLKH